MPGLVQAASREFGAQAVVVTLDVKEGPVGQSDRAHNGTCDTKTTPLDAARKFEQQGAGEILLYAIDRDGTWSGFDLKLIETVSRGVTVPVIATGGAGSTPGTSRPR